MTHRDRNFIFFPKYGFRFPGVWKLIYMSWGYERPKCLSTFSRSSRNTRQGGLFLGSKGSGEKQGAEYFSPSTVTEQKSVTRGLYTRWHLGTVLCVRLLRRAELDPAAYHNNCSQQEHRVSHGPLTFLNILINSQPGASLVVPWWRVHLPMQETWVQSLVQEDPTCLEKLSPRTTATEPAF